MLLTNWITLFRGALPAQPQLQPVSAWGHGFGKPPSFAGRQRSAGQFLNHSRRPLIRARTRLAVNRRSHGAPDIGE